VPAAVLRYVARMRSGTVRTASLACSFSIALAVLSGEALAAAPLRVEGRHFRDESGRAVVLRGVNVAGNSKVPPFTAASDPAIFEPLAGWGMNVVRLLFTWEAYEPSQGAYDEAYLDYYAGAAKAAWEHGLYVIVDFHQDAFSRFSIDGCGEGFPVWALPPEVAPDTPDNGPACANWGIKMQTDADMKTAWTAFHADTYGVKTRYLAMLGSVSSRLSSEPGVIGYDIMNEPWGDEASEIGPFYEDAAAAIRVASPDAIVFVSPHALTSAGKQTELAMPSFGSFAYSPHFYDASVVLFDSWSGVEPDQPFADMNGKAEEWGVPLFLGEFGAPGPAEEGAAYVDMLYRRLDEGLASGAQWVYTPGWTEAAKDGWNDEDFSIVDGAGETRDNFRVRPFPAKVSGTPTLFRVTHAADAEERSVEVEWEHAPETGVTEVFVPAQALFGSDEVAIETAGAGLECEAAGDWMTCSSPQSGVMRAVVKKGALPEVAAAGGCVVSVGIRNVSSEGGLAVTALLVGVAMGRRRRRCGATGCELIS
jgi:endoglycosylceramidase